MVPIFEATLYVIIASHDLRIQGATEVQHRLLSLPAQLIGQTKIVEGPNIGAKFKQDFVSRFGVTVEEGGEGERLLSYRTYQIT